MQLDNKYCTPYVIARPAEHYHKRIQILDEETETLTN